jgi:hypothetical protein
MVMGEIVMATLPPMAIFPWSSGRFVDGGDD